MWVAQEASTLAAVSRRFHVLETRDVSPQRPSFKRLIAESFPVFCCDAALTRSRVPEKEQKCGFVSRFIVLH